MWNFIPLCIVDRYLSVYDRLAVLASLKRFRVGIFNQFPSLCNVISYMFMLFYICHQEKVRNIFICKVNFMYIFYRNSARFLFPDLKLQMKVI